MILPKWDFTGVPPEAARYHLEYLLDLSRRASLPFLLEGFPTSPHCDLTLPDWPNPSFIEWFDYHNGLDRHDEQEVRAAYAAWFTHQP